ncbi:putative two-component regulator [Campylobacter sputorum subsp. bubulus]|uniref:Putative two-component regulator n=1 Tax=Campylobacter sputorum subsp. sputorum TaxID=32024 RepID=A0A381DL11_9BACT|nr:response regulator [Campylobacter sputorum]ASM34715.1 two-component system response regulator [Campylobacter sputorum aubsp. sputorum RM3237]QEL04906.1 two-component system response regulator [Campylobacter sputorum subsp. sputorum]SUX09976.1 putative two-component regulator [Campylobacter sputorum subsp. bubulus]SUX11392.1 putative two-component regulator [Campylobacter sputorum subsp. sputorum]
MQLSTLKLLENFTIMIVEDDETALSMLELGLKPYCKKLFLARDGLEGLEIFKKNQIDMILTDLHMSNLNGFEMIKIILSIKPSQNFIVMTSYDSDQNFLNSIKHGALNFIRKPLNMLTIQSSLIIALSNIKSEKKQISKRVSVDYSNENIYLDDELVFLSQNNHKIFWLFLYNLNNVVSYELIESYVYNDENFSKKALQMSIKRIKSQLVDIKLENISSIGYILKS